MTEQDTGRETRLIDIKGRQVVVRKLGDTQLLFLTREAQVLTRPGVQKERLLLGATRLLDILESAIVQPSDQEYVTDLAVKGKLELSDLFEVLAAFRDPKAAEEKPVVRRGRPRKATV